MAYVNGEWQEDDDQNQGNPMAGLTSTLTPNRQGTTMSAQSQAYESPDWQSKVNTMGLNPNWDTLKSAGQANNISPEDWSKGFQYYNDNITPFAGNSEWWGQDAMTRAGMQGYAGANPTANFNYSQYTNPQNEAMQQKQKADEGMAKQAKNGGGGLGDLGTLGILAALAATVFSGGAAAPLLAGEASFAPGAFASAFIPEASVAAGGMAGLPSFLAPTATAAGGAAALNSLDVGGSDWMNEIGAGAGNGGATLPSYDGASLGDMFGGGGGGYDASWGSNFRGDPGANTMFGNPGSSATNLEQALQVPQPQNVPTVDGQPMTEVNGPGLEPSGGYNPETATSIDQVAKAGLDSPAPIREAGQAANLSDTLRLGAKSMQQFTNNPWFQGGRLALNEFQKQQRYSQLKDLYSQMQQKSDVGAPFRDQLMRSYTDPNFFKNMPEFKAGGEAFNQQYQATAAQKGQRSQLGGAAQEIAVNRENARLADIYRSRLGQMAGQAPNMQGMAGLAGQVGTAGAARGASLFDPQLWQAMNGMAGSFGKTRIPDYSAGIDDSGMY